MKHVPAMNLIVASVWLSCGTSTFGQEAATPEEKAPMQRTLRLEPSKNNPRNSEGDFAQLKDGRILFVYSHFTGGPHDESPAYLAGRFSKDGGRTWTTEDVVVLPNEGRQNVMSVSLLRLQSGEIALFYLVKNSSWDCIPHMRISTDEARTWSEARACIGEPGYYVVHNDRIVQLQDGRLVMPVNRHDNRPNALDYPGTVMCYLSDDRGATWHRSKDPQKGFDASGKRICVHEPVVAELADGRLLMLCRTDAGCQYLSHSKDKGESWTTLKPSNIFSPLAPVSMQRIPGSGDLLLVWNDHAQIDPKLKNDRTPLCVAISRDNGQTWVNRRVLEDSPVHWYCYTAIHFVGDDVLLGYCAGKGKGAQGLSTTQITRFPLKWLTQNSHGGQSGD